jgi:hypothetical protein
MRGDRFLNSINRVAPWSKACLRKRWSVRRKDTRFNGEPAPKIVSTTQCLHFVIGRRKRGPPSEVKASYFQSNWSPPFQTFVRASSQDQGEQVAAKPTEEEDADEEGDEANATEETAFVRIESVILPRLSASDAKLTAAVP